MSNHLNARRAFFVGKISDFLKVLTVGVLLAYPTAIKADTAVITPAPAQTAATAAASTPATASLNLAPAASKDVWVTAYTSAPDETSAHPLITASGGMVHDGIVAANFLPFGTKIEIPSLFGSKVFVVEDRTSQRFSGRVDIWMPTVNKAIDFGIRHAKIVILDAGVAMR